MDMKMAGGAIALIVLGFAANKALFPDSPARHSEPSVMVEGPVEVQWHAPSINRQAEEESAQKERMLQYSGGHSEAIIQ